MTHKKKTTTTSPVTTKYAERKARLGPAKWAARLAVRKAAKARRDAARAAS